MRTGAGDRAGRAAGLAAVLLLLTALPAAAGGECSCDELRKYEETVEKKLDCYKQTLAAAKDAIWFSQSDTLASMVTCMGWDPASVVSEGKPESASAEEKQKASDACHENHCDWICEASIAQVHEKAHTFFDRNYRMSLFTLLASGVVLGPTAMQRENITGEIVAHQAEAQFLLEKISEMERKGQCAGISRSVSPEERQRILDEAARWLDDYLKSLQEKP